MHWSKGLPMRSSRLTTIRNRARSTSRSATSSRAALQRSRIAYRQNPEEERRRYHSEIDVEMTLLKFAAAGRPIGVLSWYPVHPTSMSFNNRLISGDNKGYAEYRLRACAARHRQRPAVRGRVCPIELRRRDTESGPEGNRPRQG